MNKTLPKNSGNNYENNIFNIPKTKFNLPEGNNQRIVRQRLIDMLNNALQGKFIHINAPAGYGKTTAVIDWIKSLDQKAIWISMGEEDDSVKRFWKSVLCSFSGTLPHILEITDDYFYLPDMDLHSELLSIFIQEIGKLEFDIILVLDDFHLIKNPIIHRGVSFFIKYLPANIKAVFISREKLPFSITKYRANGHLKEILAADLCLTNNELGSFLDITKTKLSQPEMDDILSKNEGWITGIQIMVMEDKHGIKNIRHYLMEEILANQDEEMKEFLLGTSLFSTFSAPLCNAIFDRSDSVKMIQKLRASNAFIFSLDQDEVWYRYHHLFLDVLKQGQQGMSEKDIKKRHKKAADWYARNEMVEDAIDHCFLAGESLQAIGMIEKIVPVYIRNNDFNKIIKWLDNLPIEILHDSHILCLTYAWYYQLKFQFDRAWDYIIKAEKVYERIMTEESANDAVMEAVKADVLHFKTIYGMLSRDYEIFIRASSELSRVNTANAVFAKFGLEINRAQPSLIFLLYENLELFAENEFLRTVQMLKEQKIKGLNYAYVLYGEMLYEFNMLDEALPLLINGCIGALEERKFGAYMPGINTTAKIYWSYGEKENAISLLKEGEQVLKKHNSILLAKKMKVFRVWLSLMMKDMVAVDEWMQERYNGISENITIQNEFDLSVYARVLIERGEYRSAEVLLARLLDFAHGMKQIRWPIMINNILARLHYSRGDFNKALDCLGTAIRLGIKHKYFRIFVEEGPIMYELLSRYLNSRQIKGEQEVQELYGYIEKIRECIKRENKFEKTADIHLTKAELNVLRMVKEGLTNEEIAKKLVIQTDTVKKHISNIYRKMNVKNRTQAVRKVEEIKILF